MSKLSLTIKKKTAIKALLNEPVLKPGSFFDAEDDLSTTKKIFLSCTVCAVGSVLREHCFIRSEMYKKVEAYRLMPSSQYSCEGSINKALSERDYLGALSVFFENVTNTFYYDSEIDGNRSDRRIRLDPNSDFLRGELVNFIEQCWPDEFIVRPSL